jgi:hypothetical protein
MRPREMSITKLRLRAGDTLVVQAHCILSKDQREVLAGYVQSKMPPDVRVMVLSNDVDLSVLGAFEEVQPWQPAPWWQFWRPASGAAGGAFMSALVLCGFAALVLHRIHAG